MGAAVTIGVDLGQRTDPTAIVVCEVERRVATPSVWRGPEGGGLVEPDEIHRTPAAYAYAYIIRDMGRLPLGTPYPDVYRHLLQIITRLHVRKVWRPKLGVGATGATAAVDHLRLALKGLPCDMVAATFTYGDQYTKTRATASVGKAFLVSRLQTLLQFGRLELPAHTPEAAAMARELAAYEIRVEPDANDRYGAFKVGGYDDLVTALGLADLDDAAKEVARRSWAQY